MEVLLPALVAIGLALWTRQVHLSLLAGLWLGAILIVGGNPVAGLAELAAQIVGVFESASNTRVVIFCLLVGGLIALVQASGGVSGFVSWARSRGWGHSRRSTELLAWLTGIVIFVESNITSLTVGAVSRPLFDAQRLPREKIAYYCDATSAPVCMMIPLNGWGAYVLGLLAAQGLAAESVGILAGALAYNFFSIGAILLAGFLAWTGWSYGPMRTAEKRAREEGALTREGSRPMISEEVASVEPVPGAPMQARDLLIPIGVMVAMIFVGLYITGEGDLMQGSGSTSVLWAVGAAIIAAAIQYRIPRGGSKIMSVSQTTDWVLRGSAGLVSVTVLIVFAFALGEISRDLELGSYVVSLIGTEGATWWMPAAIFLTGCLLSFTLGSSWTCFALLVPVAMPLAEGLGLSPALLLGAVLSGGIFGDHASPLSDTSIISSLSAACDHADHVNTQMPYALTVAGLSLVGFLIAGWAG